jgi:hypothetical protein
MEERSKAGQKLDPWLQGVQRSNSQSKEEKKFTQNLRIALCHHVLLIFSRFVSLSFSPLSLPM